MPSFAEILQALPVIISLIVIEGLLSVDNALAIAAMASHLPGRQKYLALRWGIVGAYAFRGLVLLFASFIIDNPWLKIIGAAYLIHLMASSLAGGGQEEKGDADEEGAATAARLAGRGFWATVISIELMDLSLSVDNVVAAVAMSPKLWVVCTGVFIGILALRFVAGWCIKLIERFPILETTAFILIGYVGCILIAELCAHLVFGLPDPIHVSSLQKFIGIVVILGLSFWYSESPIARAIFKPLIKVVRPLLIAYSTVSNLVVGAIVWPFKTVIGWFTRSSAHSDMDGQ